ncbi:dTMP kinase, partial [Streptomyces sp. NPDC057540]
RTAAAERAAAEKAASERAARSAEVSANEVTVETPIVQPDAPTVSPDEITVATPIVKPDQASKPKPERASASSERPEAETALLPQIRDPREADETAVLPSVRNVDETAVLPPVRDARSSDPADRVPPGIFRDERAEPQGANDRTRELPQLDENGRPRRRSDWAEETPLDDLPTLADELFGPHDDEDDGRTRRR